MRGAEHSEVTFESRVRGCLLGGAIGDALGAPVKFDSIADIRHHHGPAGLTDLVADWQGEIGLVTDDTQMAMFTVEGLIRADVRSRQRGFASEVEVVRHAYLRWLDTQWHTAPPPADELVRTGWLREQPWLYSRRAPSDTCLSGLRHSPGPKTAPGEPGAINPGSKGCAAVTRSAPFGLSAQDARTAFRLAAQCAQLTHGHPTGGLAAGAFAAIIFFLGQAHPMAQAVRHTLDLLAEHPAHDETTSALETAMARATKRNPSPETVETLGGGEMAEEALAIAVYSALAYEHDVEQALLLAVNHSGASDSTGAICGNLLGTRHGDTALPQRWLSPLEGRNTLTELADDYTTEFTGRPVPFTKYPGC
ncbi:ADP-ribosylglycohydrolase family protein [Sphaerisporangium dianthi]|uniref:ADP-ribosylglycohydrolase family protein n=1 Tax=Sphaerisporangium dianthi TaxID=1436120 RepID=A0ABV9C8Y8_9ACTN